MYEPGVQTVECTVVRVTRAKLALHGTVVVEGIIFDLCLERMYM
jgi:hypothetical protein